MTARFLSQSSPFRRFYAALILLLVAMVCLPLATVSAQGEGLVNGDEYHLDIERVLTWDRPWEVDLNLTEYDPATDSDLVVLRNDAATMIFLAEKAVGGEPGDYRDRIVDAALNEWDAEILMTSDDETGSSAVWIEGSGDSAFGAYYLATLDGEDLITTRLTAPVSDFGDYWQALQEEVALDDQALFPGVDADAVIATITGPNQNASQEGGSRGSADEPAGDASSEREEAPAEPAPADTGREAPGGPPPDLEEAGLISDGVYESPQFGYRITWEPDWDLDGFYDQPVATAEAADGADVCYLAQVDGDVLLGYISFQGRLNPFDSIQEYIDFLTSDENLEQAYAGREAKVMLEQDGDLAGSYLLELTNPDTRAMTFVLVQVTDVGEGAALVTLFSGPTLTFMESLESAQQNIALNDESILTMIDNDEIADALAS